MNEITPDIWGLFDAMARLARRLEYGYIFPDVSDYEENLENVRSLYNLIQKKSGLEVMDWPKLDQYVIYDGNDCEVAFATIKVALKFDRIGHTSAESYFLKAINALEKLETEIGNDSRKISRTNKQVAKSA